MTRDERQLECFNSWKAQKYKGTICAATGFGKTRLGTNAIQRLLKVRPDSTVLVVVPTDVLKQQWTMILADLGLFHNTKVEIINTIVKNSYDVDFLIVDECHRLGAEEFKKAFYVIKYKLIMCLTATLNRLDGKESIIKEYAPVCDIVTIKDCLKNGWVSDFQEYKVILDVDLDEYYTEHKKFLNHFSFFNFDFSLAMSCVSDYNVKRKFAKETENSLKDVSLHAAQFVKSLKARKDFVQNHPKKVEIAQKIIAARRGKKIVTFSQTKDMAESIGEGVVYHSKVSKTKRKTIISEFSNQEAGVINAVKALDEGVDIKGLSVAITLCGTSSEIQRAQRLGRAIRFEKGKKAETFHLIIGKTMEEEWFRKSSKGLSYIVIHECELDDILNGNFEDHLETQDEKKKHMFRF